MKLSIILATVFLFLIGCTPSATQLKLTANDWQVERIIIGDSVVLLETEEHPSLTFNADSTFGGQTMCNSISGTYRASESGQISMSIEAITSAFCPENTIEGIFIEQIALSHHYKMVGDTLHFTDDDGRTVIYLTATDRVSN